jgi:F-type H+-transporting ATPase subunit b
MPQFDPAVWMPQFIWLAISFVALYLLMARIALPRIGEILEEREFKINDNLRKAELLRHDAEEAVAAYEKILADARSESQAATRTAREQAAREAAASHAEFSERLSRKVAVAETRIAEARDAASRNIRAMAAEIAALAVDRLTGTGIDAEQAGKAVDAALAEARS